jgi:hypothetical protein
LNRKLLILDLALIAALIYGGAWVRERYRRTKASQAAVLNRPTPVVPAPAFPPAPAVPPVLPSGYADIAQKMLFDKSRNSTVVIETPAPPAPKPMPPLPAYHGQMKLPGQDLIVFLSESGHGPQRPVRLGDSVGEFKLLEANSEALTLEWDGKTITKDLKELVEKGGPVAQAAAGVAVPRAAPPPPPPAARPLTGPGQDLGGYKACAANDGYPDGAVVDGYRKVVIPSPFAPNGLCRWDPAAR